MYQTSIMVATIAALGMISPGPDFFLIIKNAARYQRSAAMMTAFGIIVAIALHMSYCVAGLAVLITTTPWLFNILKYAGAAYLIWIGIKSLMPQKAQSVDLMSNQHEHVTFKKAFMQGFLCNVLNPKATLFFLAIFTQVLSVDSTFSEKLWFAFIIWGLAVIYWPILVCLIQSAPVRKGLAKVQKYVDKVLGVVLVAFGIRVALS
ncbi:MULTISPECIES: LysE family translocator [Providencia]|jgi:RhtB (resistance to homoserine/threonine) family protein|uniref:LysE family translocator n=1 Tax=Providencia TaxID=586 RepID=UPI0003E29C7A|nr:MULTISPECIES: LysE family transporter [Providencia]ETS98230.1 homoserine/Threonine efflux protein [Providencia alcalifaciens PAL-3]EUC97861.1 homoserine/Threonine efflux protein [Providencia alcalifaciens PAL-1]MBG5883359.1 LysE family transporter [Providencia alcalifaciens]MTB46432.1 LysE family translocator [Providencia sp. wls1950]MTC23078.1 LysE family translocator [Providencia sp. wls1938]